MNPRIALATSSELPELTADDKTVLTALGELGFEACPAVWSDATIEWRAFDAVVMRSTWDYVANYDDFLDWVESLPSLSFNPKEVLVWNTNKKYLRTLEMAGLPVIPTLWIDDAESIDYELPHWLERPEVAIQCQTQMVVKPSVSAGARDTVRLKRGEALRDPIDVILRSGRGAMVQPYFVQVDTHGETDLIFFRGVFSHAVCKAALLSGTHAEEEVFAPCDPSPAELELAERVFETLPYDADDLLYARLDLIRDYAGRPTVLELELVEPSLFFGSSRGANERFARALQDLIACRSKGRL